ncbi:MAG: pyrroline-5-carboxylate reductase [Clostridia bacterium]|nr:pyrroline-5-carboxylate reductase [Clostridia bacterium]
MATALAKGFISSGTVADNCVTISDKFPESLKKWSDTKVKTTTDNKEVFNCSDIVIFAVKPNILPNAMTETKSLAKGKIVVSIAAGVTISTMEDLLGSGIKIVRAMPNTPAQVGCGMTVLSPNKNVSTEDMAVIRNLFSGAGDTLVLEEKYINAATALHGSSPAYIYMLIDTMADCGVKYGIPKNIGIQLAAKAVEGSAKMVLQTQKHPTELKDAVCSPGGTTIAAVLELEKNGFSSSVNSAIDACITRAEEMSKN